MWKFGTGRKDEKESVKKHTVCMGFLADNMLASFLVDDKDFLWDVA